MSAPKSTTESDEVSVVQVMVAVVCAGVLEIEEMMGADGGGFPPPPPPPPCELATVTEIVEVAKFPEVSSATASSV